MPDGAPTPFRPISERAGREWLPWAYCRDEAGCGHNAPVDIASVIARPATCRPIGFVTGCAARSAAGGRGW
jgi:hypothetical protein